MSKQEFISKLVDTLRLEAPNLTGSDLLANVIGWDSMAAIEFINFADTWFSTRISADQLAKCRTVDDLAALFGDRITP
jgi:acyl carrier protein